MGDLRIIKTKKAIEDSFLSLRKKTDLDKIKVSELCSVALINKTTFYNYYNDIYELSEELEDKYIKECFFGFDGYDCLINDTEKFILGVYKSFVNSSKIQILFKNRISTLVEKAQQEVLNFYQDTINTEDTKMKVVFLIHGAFYLLLNYKGKASEEEKLKMIINYINNFLKKIPN